MLEFLFPFALFACSSPEDTKDTGAVERCPGSPIAAIDAHGYAACALHQDGCLECDAWGGPAPDTDWDTDLPPEWEDHGEANVPDLVFSAVSVSEGDAPLGYAPDPYSPEYGICALDLDGYPVCWGQPYDDPGAYANWVDPPSTQLVSLATGFRHACGVDDAGSISCWGACEEGSCAAPTGHYLGVASGEDFSCGLSSSGSVECWGEFSDPLGLTGETYESLRGGRDFVCANDGSMALSCYTKDGNEPIDRALESEPADWALAGWHSGSYPSFFCALDDGGSLSCAGDEDWPYDLAAITTISESSYVSLTGGVDYLCGLTADGEANCAVWASQWNPCSFCTIYAY